MRGGVSEAQGESQIVMSLRAAEAVDADREERRFSGRVLCGSNPPVVHNGGGADEMVRRNALRPDCA